MNEKVRKKLCLERPWGNQNALVFHSLLEDNMKPVINQGKYRMLIQKNKIFKRFNKNAFLF